VSELYSGPQFVGMDLHRRSLLVRMTESGEHLETVRIVNTDDRLADVMSRAGECPEVVLEATYGWYWAADTPFTVSWSAALLTSAPTHSTRRSNAPKTSGRSSSPATAGRWRVISGASPGRPPYCSP
jgi:hypothetical protein